MKNRKFISLVLLVFVVFALSACTPTQEPAETTETEVADTTADDEKLNALEEELEAKSAEITSLENELESAAEKLEETVTKLEALQSMSSSTNLLSTAIDVLEALDIKDMTALQSLSHPSTPIRFTPYAYVDTSNDLTFSANAFPTLINDPTIYTWGEYDGSGDPMNLTFDAYLDAFVYDEDYLNPHMIGINNVIGQGNSINNVSSVYPNATFVEFHFTGFDPQYGGLDWTSLILVFEQVAGDWKLIAIVHNQWTI